jgi:hypothetical protein
MKLDAWLRQDHSLADRLRLVERLAQALNSVHDRGEVLGALAPGRVELGTDLLCDLSGATRGALEPGYAAPERATGSPPSPEADVYSAGAIAWEALVGRPCGEAPAALAEAAPGVPGELASAVMGCLERSPQWRPKDLTYLAQLAAAQQKAARRGTEPERVSPAPRGPASYRTPPRRPSPRWPLVVAAGALLVLSAAGYWWIQGQGPDEPRASVVRPRARSTPPPPVPTPVPSPTATPSAPAEPQAPARVAAPTPSPTPAATPTPAAPVASAPPAAPRPTPTVAPTPTPAPPAVAVSAPTAASGAPAVATEPVVLTALSPLAIRRPGRVLLDVRGTGLRPDLRARILPLREVPHGITVARQKWVSANLVTVLLELDGSVTPAVYAIDLEDAGGGHAKPLQFTVTK